MPIYEYQCEKCGHFEVTQRITAKPLGKCPTCRQKVKKLISNTSFHLKGTGWYLTDYARKGKSPESEKGTKASGANGKADGKSEASSGTGKKVSGETKPAKQKDSESSAS